MVLLGLNEESILIEFDLWSVDLIIDNIKVGTICWMKKELSWRLGTLHIFFRNTTFLFAKIESWNFQQLFDLGFRETLQNFSLFR